MHRKLICALFLMQHITAIDNWEQALRESSDGVGQDGYSFFLHIKQKMVGGAGLTAATKEQVEKLTRPQLDALNDHLITYQQALLFVREYQGRPTFWRHLVRTRKELVANQGIHETVGACAQETYASRGESRKEQINSLQVLLQQQLMRRGNIQHDPDPTHLLNPDSMYYVQRRLIDATANIDNHQENPKMCFIIKEMIATGATLTLIRSYDVQSLSLQELDDVKEQLAIYHEAIHVAERRCGNAEFWGHVCRINHNLKEGCIGNSASSACIAEKIKHCDAARSLIQHEIALRGECDPLCRDQACYEDAGAAQSNK